jgi:hypothetical protein
MSAVMTHVDRMAILVNDLVLHLVGNVNKPTLQLEIVTMVVMIQTLK